MYKKFQQFWWQEKSLLVLLVLLSVHMFVILPLGEHSAFGKILTLVFYILVVSAGLNYLAVNKKFTVALTVSTICIAGLGANRFTDEMWVTILSDAMILLYCALLAWIVLRRTFSEGPITIYRIQGSIVGYLLIGLFFASLQNMIFHLEGEAAFNGLKDPELKEFVYFSLTTLTTVGYGDISPAIPISRSIANIEALFGQLYPAIFIARLVSMVITEKTENSKS